MSAFKPKRTTIWVSLVLLALVLLSGSPVLANPDPDTLLTNPLNRHNLSNWATHGGVQAALVDGTDQICIFCHTPHAAEPVPAPLWNRSQPVGPVGGFPLYGGTLAIKDDYGAGVQAAAQYGPSFGDYPNGASRLCMSCHDGVTAIGVGLLRGGADVAMTGTNLDDGSLLNTLGTVIDLATAHPISFVYDDSVAASVNAAYVSMFGSGPYYQGPAAFDPGVNSPLDSQSRMQCTTCHDPHYDTSLAAGGGGLPPFWQNPSSTTPYDDVCNQCHVAPPSSMTPAHP